MKGNWEEKIAGIVLIVFSLAYIVGAFMIPMPALKQQLGPSAFPIAIGLGMLVLAVVYAGQQFLGKRPAGKTMETIEKKADIKTMGFVLALMLLYAFFFEILGYAITTFLIFMAGAIYLDGRHVVRDGMIAIIASFVLYYIFTFLLRVQLPAGPLKFLEY